MTIRSRFNMSDQGWTTSNGTLVYDPAGFITGSESGVGIWTFVSNNAFLGDKESYYGGTISFDLSQPTQVNQFDDGDIILTGGGQTIVIDAGPNPSTSFTSYTVDLQLGAGWRLGSLNGTVASEADIRNVLANLTSFEIRGEFVSGTSGDTSSLDNVEWLFGDPDSTQTDISSVFSDFETGTDGWSFTGDLASFDRFPSGGNPGGYLQGTDAALGDIWYWLAPTAFIRQKAQFYDGTLSFDLQQSTLSSQITTNDPDVIITGNNGLTIAYDLPNNPGLTWTSYSVTLAEGDWKVGDLSGPAATEAQIRSVLESVVSLQIRGEYATGLDMGGIDNVQMRSQAGVNRFVDSSFNVFSEYHTTLADALASSSDFTGLAIVGPLSETGPFTINHNFLSINTEEGFDKQFILGAGITELTFDGQGAISVKGNGTDNFISGTRAANRLEGENGNDLLLGGFGDDTLIGGERDDTLNGSVGMDVLRGGTGADSLQGGDGDDLLFGGGNGDTLLGENGADTIIGEDGEDVIAGQAGADSIAGGAGNDTIDGGTENDTLRGGSGFDTIFGRSGNDLIEGQQGADFIEGGDGRDVIDGGGGQNTLFGGTGDDYLRAGKDADTISGDSGSDTIDGGDGNDYISGGSERDTLKGGAGSDTISGGENEDVLRGQDGGDELSGNLGDDTIFGGAGEDSIWGGAGSDSIDAGTQADTVKAGDGDDIVLGNNGADSLDGEVGNDTMLGGAGDDVITGYIGNDSIEGGAGSDTLTGSLGSDTLDGGEGADRISGNDDGDVIRGGRQNDTIFGGAGNDSIEGNEGSDTISGGSGADVIFGNQGFDTINGGAGDDRLYGGLDFDDFVFESNFGSDRIFGFDAGIDDIVMVGFVESDLSLNTIAGTTIVSVDGLSDSIEFVATVLVDFSDFTFL